jgi:hypothetical protein
MLYFDRPGFVNSIALLLLKIHDSIHINLPSLSINNLIKSFAHLIDLQGHTSTVQIFVKRKQDIRPGGLGFISTY